MTEEELIERVSQLELITSMTHYVVCPMAQGESLDESHLMTATIANDIIHDYYKKWDNLETVDGRSNRFIRWADDYRKLQ